MKTLFALALLGSFCAGVACSSIPTAADARDALTRACVATASVEALTKGTQLPKEIDLVCGDPALQARLVNVVQQGLELHEAIKAVPPQKADAGTP